MGGANAIALRMPHLQLSLEMVAFLIANVDQLLMVETQASRRLMGKQLKLETSGLFHALLAF